jgi:hypothetical protein
MLLCLAAVASSTAYADPPRRIMLATDPLSIVNGTYTLTAALAVHDHAAITGEASFTSADDSLPPGIESSREQVGLRLFLDRAFHGPFVEPGLRRAHSDGTFYAADETGAVHASPFDQRTFGPIVSIGWQWTFHDRWTLSYALTAAKIWSSSGNVLGWIPQAESNLRLGVVF